MRTFWLCVGLYIGLFSGCTARLVRVMPYEKEYLAQEKMGYTPVPAWSEQRNHVFLIREASAGGHGGFQGGCGCR